MTNLRSLPADTRGVTALEYALIAAIIAVVTVCALQGVGNSLLHNFTVIVEAAREAPQPMEVVDTRLPNPPVQEAPQPARAPVPDHDDSSSPGPSQAEAGTTSPGAGADPGEPAGQEPGIAPAEPALGPWDDGLPVAALVTPPGRGSSRNLGAGNPGSGAGARALIGEAPPGRETSGDDSGGQTASERPARDAAAQAKTPAPPMFNDRQKAAIRSAFILFLWAAFALALANLIWRIATRKAHEKEVEDQLEGWQPASFG